MTTAKKTAINMAETRSTWLVTGSSSGLGKSLASESFRAGYKVIGTTRAVASAESACPSFSAKGGIWMEVDPAREDCYEEFVEYAAEHNIDVLVK